METVNGSVDLITRGLGESWTKSGQDRTEREIYDVDTHDGISGLLNFAYSIDVK